MAIKSLVTYDNMVMAQSMCGLLADNGIRAMLNDQNLNTSISYGAQPAGYEVLVEEEDYEHAKALAEIIEDERKQSSPWCPVCGSEDTEKTTITHKHGKPWFFVLGILFILCGFGYFAYPEYTIFIIPCIGILLLVVGWFKSYTEDIYHCKNCGKDFKRDSI